MRKHLFLLLALAHGAVACQHALPLNEYNAYLNDPDNGLVQASGGQAIDLVCAFKPTQLYAYQDAQAAGIPADSAAAQLQGNVYVTLSFAKNGQEVENAFLGDENQHNACLSYLTHYVYQDVTLCTATDTVPAAASTYARQYGATKASTILVVFAKGQTDLSHGFDIVYRGQKFNLRTVRFPFTADALAAIPALRY